MKRVFIIHRWEGGSHDDWRPWLKQELQKLGYEVIVPDMPDTNTPDIEKWVSHLRSIVGTVDEGTYFVGHSIGCQTILRFLETCDHPCGGAVFVAGWFNLLHLEDDEAKKVAHPWLTIPIDLQRIKKVLPKSTLIISDNDPYGAFEENIKKFKELDSEIIVLEDAGHITEDDGYITLPILLQKVQELG